jgi:lambda family phage portal protein
MSQLPEISDLDAIEQMPSLEAAAHNAASLDDRSMSDWLPMSGSADADIINELDVMVARARDLPRNNGVVSGAHQTLKDNIIGATLRLSAKPDYRLLGKDIEWARAWSRSTEAQFRSWADTTECDAGRSLTLLGLSLQILNGAFLNGDGLALPIWKPRGGSRWGTRLHVIESDRLATPTGMDRKKYLNGGVQSDQHGEPHGYWIMKNHPGDKFGMLQASPDQWTFIPAFTAWGRRRVVHLHDKERSGQSRGTPLVKSVMRELNMAGKYTSTELQTTIANSLIAGVLESDLDPESMNDIFGEGTKDKYDQFVGGFRGQLKAGAIIKAPPGTKMHLLNAGRNNSGFEQYMTSVLRYISTGLNIPYELLMKDFSKTNYSSARAAMLEAWRYFYGRRRWLSDYWLNSVYELWLEEAIQLGRVDAPDYYENKYAYTRCRWIMQGRGWVDPVKEAKAAQIRMDSNLSTLEQECAEQGLDYEEVLEQKAYEKKMAQDLGVPLKIDGVKPGPAPAAPANAPKNNGEPANA